MRTLIVLLLVIVTRFAFAQPPKNSNVIIVTGTGYGQCMNYLLDAGYHIEKSDSVYKTIRTDFKNVPLKNGKESLVDMAIDIRLKNDTALITGRYYNKITLTSAFGGNGKPGPNDIFRVAYAAPSGKACFNKMNEFAISLKGQIIYQTNKP